MKTSLPAPGPVQGLYPQRSSAAVPWRAAQKIWQRLSCPTAGPAGALRCAGAALPRIRANQAAWLALPPQQASVHLLRLRALLQRSGWQHAKLRAQALGCAAAALQRTLGRDPYDTQLICAQLLLQGRLAEMGTGEGKTLAVALAAGAAAMAGVPVHVMTSNDYLVSRDALQLAPFFAALGLSNGAVCASSDAQARRAAHACDITHSTAREVAFDHLRDRELLRATPSDLQQRALRLCTPDGPAPVLRGLCMALVDEADSLLIDEATMPLVLAETVDDPAHRATCVQALTLARGLQLGADVIVHTPSLEVAWTASAQDLLQQRSAGWGGAWQHGSHRQEQVGLALVALHGLQRDRHYLVRDGKVELLDSVTGRTAQGRVWSRGLQTLVELKEGCAPSPQTRTRAQTSYQRFFARYLHLAGTSGTLAECRRELSRVYELQVVSVPLRTACRRQQQPARAFSSATQRAAALAPRVQALVAAGRPVLIGTATVAQAAVFSAQLTRSGITHRVLDARNDDHEAQIIAGAGQAGAVTVATAMAGRGTDIGLGPGVAEAGGLHVVLCQDNRCARLDRQFIGRAGRQGEPGSAEIWHAPNADGHGETSAAAGAEAGVDAVAGTPAQALTAITSALPARPGWWLGAHKALQQRLHQSREMRRRRRLLEQELSWEKQLRFKHLHA